MPVILVVLAWQGSSLVVSVHPEACGSASIAGFGSDKWCARLFAESVGRGPLRMLWYPSIDRQAQLQSMIRMAMRSMIHLRCVPVDFTLSP